MGITVAVAVPHPPLIVPEIGKGRDKEIQNTIDAYEKAAQLLASYRPETIVLFSPHQTMYADYFHIAPGRGAKGDFGQFGAGEVKLEAEYDTEFVTELCRKAKEKNLPAGTQGEQSRRLDHGTMVPLYFVNQYYRSYRLVSIGLSGESLLTHYELGQCVKAVAESLGRRTALIASGDLSHRLKEEGPYGFRPEGPKYDRKVMEVLESGRFEELLDFSEDFCEKAGECGHRSFTLMAGALDKTSVQGQKLSYEGPFGVGYGICTYEVRGKDEDRNLKERYEEEQKRKADRRREAEDAYVRLAHQTIEEYTRTGRKPELPEDLPKEMYHTRAGAFVSIKKEGRLRGCIGTIQAVYSSLAEEIIENAVSAASRDPRFSPIKPEELPLLTVSVDVLGATEKITSLEELDVKRYGVIVSKGMKRGLLLPNLDGVDTVEEQISIARQKAGIGAKEPVELERFEVVRHY